MQTMTIISVKSILAHEDAEITEDHEWITAHLPPCPRASVRKKTNQ